MQENFTLHPPSWIGGVENAVSHIYESKDIQDDVFGPNPIEAS